MNEIVCLQTCTIIGPTGALAFGIPTMDSAASPRGRRRRKSSLLDAQNEIVRRVSTMEHSSPRHRSNSCLTRMSWYQDALLQQGVSEADLQALLKADKDASEELPKEQQVAEQHRIMAIHKARKLLEDSLGRPFEPPKQLEWTDPPRPKYTPTLHLPELPKPTTDHALAARQTCLIPPSVPIHIGLEEAVSGHKNPVIIDTTDEPDIQLGTVVPDESVATRGNLVVRCASCPTLLRVSLKAALVRCPQCRDLTPASDSTVPTVITE